MSTKRDSRNKIVVASLVFVTGWFMQFYVIANTREAPGRQGSECVKHTAQSLTCYWENGDVEDLGVRVRP